MTIRSVFFDVGETIVDESREYGTWADWLGVPRHTLSAVFGAVNARGLDYRETFQVFRPGFDLADERERRAAAGQPASFSIENLYPDARLCLAALRDQGLLVGLAGNQYRVRGCHQVLNPSAPRRISRPDHPPPARTMPTVGHHLERWVFGEVVPQAAQHRAAIGLAYLGDQPEAHDPVQQPFQRLVIGRLGQDGNDGPLPAIRGEVLYEVADKIVIEATVDAYRSPARPSLPTPERHQPEPADARCSARLRGRLARAQPWQRPLSRLARAVAGGESAVRHPNTARNTTRMVAAYIAAHADELDESGRRLVVRNGRAEPRQVLTSAGAVEVVAPRVNDKRTDEQTGERRRFSSVILPPWCRRSPKINEVLPLLYLHGLSSLDFVPALEGFLGTGSGLSAATVTRLTVQWAGRGRGV